MQTKLCVIGAGAWGENHVRTLHELGALGGVMDMNPDRLAEIGAKYDTETFSTLEDSIARRFDGYEPDVVCSLVRAAHESGAIVCADTKIPTFRSMSLRDLEPVLPMIDYFFPNDTEAAFLTGIDGNYEEMAGALIDKGICHVVIKAGEQGIFAADAESGECFMLPALKVPVVDTTGAGDNLVAGFMDGLLRGADFRGCCEAGLEAAALSIQHLGATI